MKPVEPIPAEEMLGESDWDDQDLLTIDEASFRLRHEIQECENKLKELVGPRGGCSSEVIRVQQRLADLKDCLAGVSAGPTPMAAL
jgi:hypothetical protein